MALSILSLGMLTPLPLSMARRRRGLKLASPPPILAATVISLAILEKAAPRFSSWRPLRCWIFAHLECPDMLTSSLCALKRPAFYHRTQTLLSQTFTAKAPRTQSLRKGDQISVLAVISLFFATLCPFAPLRWKFASPRSRHQRG